MYEYDPPVRIAFAYEHRYRVVDVERLWQSKSGDWLVTGRDADRDGDYRSYRVDKMHNKPRAVNV